MKFDINAFYQREVELASVYLEHNPDDILQKDRLATAYLKLGDINKAKEFGTSDKLKDLIEQWERKNS